MSKEGRLIHSHTDVGLTASRALPAQTQPQLLLLLEPTFAPRSLLVGQGWKVGATSAPSMLLSPAAQAPQDSVAVEAGSPGKEADPTLSLTCPHVFMSTG